MPAILAWTPERVAEAASVAAQRGNAWRAIAGILSDRWGEQVTHKAVKSKLERENAREPAAAAHRPAVVSNVGSDPAIAQLVEVAKRHARRGGLTLETLADALDMPPGKARALVDRARTSGYTVDVVHGELAFKPAEPSREVAHVDAGTRPGAEQAICVISDLHHGSAYSLGAQQRAFVEHAYSLGIRDVFCPGDVLEGCYRHAQWELSHRAWHEQAQAFLDSLPSLPGLRFHFIDGNHDWTWTERDGYESGRKLVSLARDQGRNDLHYYGSRGALIDYGGTKIELFHPKKGAAYALSYQLQNKIRDTAPERLPDILLCGHVHQYVKFRRQNVWAFYCGTFQHGDGPYGRSLGGDTATGGLIIRWRKDADGVVRTLSDAFHVADHVAPTYAVQAGKAAA